MMETVRPGLKTTEPRWQRKRDDSLRGDPLEWWEINNGPLHLFVIEDDGGRWRWGVFDRLTGCDQYAHGYAPTREAAQVRALAAARRVLRTSIARLDGEPCNRKAA